MALAAKKLSCKIANKNLVNQLGWDLEAIVVVQSVPDGICDVPSQIRVLLFAEIRMAFSDEVGVLAPDKFGNVTTSNIDATTWHRGKRNEEEKRRSKRTNKGRIRGIRGIIVSQKNN